MDLEIIKEIFAASDLPVPQAFRKIEVGFSNAVYAVDEKYILKVCDDTNNEATFSLEVKLYEHFKHQLPVPRPVAFDATRSLTPNLYMLYPMIIGENLYNLWHTYSDETRKDVVKQLCGMLRHISETDSEELTEFLVPVSNWRDVVLGRIRKYVSICTKAGTVSDLQVQEIEQFCLKYGDCLNEQRMALVYWDAHFDNILVKNGRIVGLLDLERTEIASIDFMLDVVKRMVDFPKKYMSEYAEPFAKHEDYARLMGWYREFFPELFAFEQLERRLDFYSLEHDLKNLQYWPNVQSLKDSVDKVLAES